MSKRIKCAIIILASLFIFAGCGTNHTAEDSDLSEIKIDLSDEYYIEFNVQTSSIFGSVKTVYALSEKDGWIYMKLGYDREQYVYKPLSDGKYIEYKYDESKRKYVATMISDALQEQIDKGNVPIESVATSKESVASKRTTVENFMYSYKTLSSALTFKGNEEKLGISCQKYEGTIKVPGTTSKLMYLIDPESGVVLESKNTTKALFVKTYQTTECVVFENTGRIPDVD